MSEVGCIYVVLLEGGLVKVGKTRNPKSRISQSAFGHRKIVDYWISDFFVGYSCAESEMIGMLGEIGNLELGREYFRGIDYSVAVSMAASCVSKRSGSDINEQLDMERGRYDEIAKKLISLRRERCDCDFIEHFEKFKPCSQVISAMLRNRGLKSRETEESLGVYGVSLLEFCLLVGSYGCDDGQIEYFAGINSIVLGKISLCDSDFLSWFYGFYSMISCDARGVIDDVLAD